MFPKDFIEIGQTVKVQNFTDFLCTDDLNTRQHLLCFFDFERVDVLKWGDTCGGFEALAVGSFTQTTFFCQLGNAEPIRDIVINIADAKLVQF